MDIDKTTFEESNVWVLVSLIYAKKPATRQTIRAAGGYVCRAVMTDVELDGGLSRLASVGLIAPNVDGWMLAGDAERLNAKIDSASQTTNDPSPAVAFNVVEEFLGLRSDGTSTVPKRKETL